MPKARYDAVPLVDTSRLTFLERLEYQKLGIMAEELPTIYQNDRMEEVEYNSVLGLFLEKAGRIFELEELSEAEKPREKGQISMYLAEKWYKLTVKEQDRSADPVEGLDVSLLQNLLLQPVLGILDPKTDARIDFVGGIRGLKELERRVHEDCAVAFAMYPTSIQELFAVADAGRLMPPKSTWFEPKLRSGLCIHSLE